MQRKKTLKAGLTFLLLFMNAAFITAETPESYRTGQSDPLIKNMPASVKSLKTKGAETYLRGVAAYIAENAVDEFDKTKKAHDWVALNIRYHASAFLSGRIPAQTVSGVVSSGLAVCQGYAEVFDYLCGLLEIECEMVSGYARGIGSSVFGRETPHESNHAWNKVRIEGKWYLIDTTWDSGYLSGRNFSPRYRTAYLFPDPKEFLHDHFPDDPADQLLPVPVSAEEFVNLPMVEPVFFSIVTGMTPAPRKVINANGEFFRLDFSSPPQYHFMFNAYTGGRENNSVFSERQRNGENTVFFHFKKSGTYRFLFYYSTKVIGRHDGIGELGFNVTVGGSPAGEVPGGAQILLPEPPAPGARIVLPRNRAAEETVFKVIPGKWKYIALVWGGDWRYLVPDENGVFFISTRLPTPGTCWLAASETESGAYEALAKFMVR